MSDRQDVPPGTWFQRHPTTTLIAVVLVCLLLITIAAEKALEWNNRRLGIFLEGERRYIRLKEYRPGTRLLMAFPQNHLPYTDNVFPKKYRLDIDDHGFIVPSRLYDRPDQVLVFLGGSTTECMFMDADHRFPYVVGRMLERQTGAKINAYNGGMSGINTLQAIDLLVNKVIPLNPQVVVFMENINDLSTLLYEGTYWNQHSARAPLETLKKKGLAVKLLKEIFIPNLNNAYRGLRKRLEEHEEDEFAGARGKKLVINQAKFVQEFAAALKTLVCTCKAWGIVPVLMTQANRITDRPDPVVAAYVGRYGSDTGISYPDFKRLYDAFNDTIREVGRQNQVMVIDLAREIPPDKKYLYDMVHFNDAGSELAAGLIAARLREFIAPR